MKMFDSVEQLVKSGLVKNKNVHTLELYTLRYWYKAANDYQEIDPRFINCVNRLLVDYFDKSPFIFLLFNKLLMSNYKIMFEKEVDLSCLINKVFDRSKIEYILDKKCGPRAASLHVNQHLKCFLDVFDPIEFYKSFVELCNSKFKDLQPIIIYCNWLYGLNSIIRIVGNKLFGFLFCNNLPDILKTSYIYKTGMLLYNNFCKKYYSYLRQQKSEEEKKYFKFFQQLTIFLCMQSIQLVFDSLSILCEEIELKNNKYKKHKVVCKAVDVLEHFLCNFIKYKSFLVEPFDTIVFNNLPREFTRYGVQLIEPIFIFSRFIGNSIYFVAVSSCYKFDCQSSRCHHSYCKKLHYIFQTSNQMCQKIFDKLHKKKLKLVAEDENEKPKH